ncbi:WD40-repeat-containing domain protein [Fusarium oxysporum]|nr:WD40-repeat-containing domain protein [Fusarium oxysporum]
MECEKTKLDSPSLYTIGWIAALAIEQAAARALLDEEHSEPDSFHPSSSDTNNYIWGRIGQHNIVIASLPAGVYGTTSAATSASDLIHSLPQLRFGLLVGIGGAIARPNDDQDIRLGDVVVGQPHGVTGGVVQYDFGKAKANGVWERTGSLDKPPAVLLKALANLQAEHEIRPSKIPQLVEAMLIANPGMKRPGSNFTYQGSENDRLFPSDYDHVGGKTCAKCDISRRIDREERETTEPMIHYGVIASGNTLIKDATFRDNLAESLGHQCLCVEMEAAGLVDRFPCLVIRGICDYADSHKNDQWQRYAASTAAAFAVELLGHVPVRQLKESPRVLEILQSLEGKVDSMSHRMQQTDLTSTLDQLPFVAEALFNSYAEEHSPMCLPETRVQLLAEIDEWVTSSESKTIFWLNGMAGTGKSTISRTVAQRQLDRDCLGANFFFKRGEASRGNMSKLIPTLARQLAIHIPGMISLIKNAIDADPSLPTKTLAEQFEKLFKEPLRKLAASSSDPTSLVIVIDALDDVNYEQTRTSDSAWIPRYQRDQRLAEQWPGTVKIRQLVSMTLPLFIAAATICRFLNDATLGGPDELLIKVLQSVLDVPKTPEVPVRILHLSFRDYLVDPDLQGAMEFWVDEKATHRRLASRCLFIMGSILRENICRLPFPGTSPSEIEGLDPQKFIPPELYYACHYWVHHYVSSNIQECEAHEIYPFLEKHLLHWLEAMSLLGHTTDCLTILHALDEWLEKYSCEDLSDLVKDALRFIRTHFSIIDEAPLQVYSSAIVFSPTNNSRILASSSTGGTVRIWNLQTGECDEVLKYPSPTGKAFAFSRDSKVLLTASGNQFVRIWKTQTWDHIILRGHTGAVNSAVISKDSKMVATSSDDATVRLWNTHTGRCEKILKGHTGKVNTAAISPCNQVLVSASVDRTLRIWDLDAGKCKKVLRGHDCDILLAVFSPDSCMIASGDVEGRIGIWNARNGAFMHELKNGLCDKKYESLMFSEDATKLIAVLSTRTALIHDIQSGNCEQAFDFPSTSFNWSVELSHDFTMILTASSDDNTVRIWDPHTQSKVLKSAKSRDNVILDVETSPNRRTVVLHTTGGHEVWSLRRNKFECLLVGDSNFIQFSPDFATVVVANERSITICNVEPGNYTCSFDIRGMVKYCLYSEDCKILVTFHMDLSICGWHLEHHNYKRLADIGYIHNLRGFFNQLNSGDVILDGNVIPVVEPLRQRVRVWPTRPVLRRDQTWITIGNEKFFRLSPECLNAEISIPGSTVIVDCISGRLVILSFDVGKAGLPPSYMEMETNLDGFYY